MTILRLGIIALLTVLCSVSHAAPSDGEKLIGAWRLISITGPDGKPVTTGVPVGMLVYTSDGHMSVQLMYPKSEHSLSNEYVQNGYEASFGTYDVHPAAHTVTHHVEGSNTRERLTGKDLPRVYQFDSKGQLIIKSARPDEHWSVTWEHY
jgi:hypothetical protein